jgi:hypothetical protein
MSNVSVTDICNRALSKLGAGRISAITDQSVAARACQACYDILRRAELRIHPWNFAIERFQLAASATAPAFGPARAFPLPTGWLRVLPPDSKANLNDRDWIIERGSILTDYTAPLEVRCVMDIEDTTLFDATFVEALASRMGIEMAEQLTQSNKKKEACAEMYKAAIAAAKKANAIEKAPQVPVADEWLTCRG